MIPARLRLARRALAAGAISGVLLALYARVEAPWFVLGWLVFAPWLANVDEAPRMRGALARGVLMSVVFALAVFPWFAAALSRYSGMPLAISAALLVVFAPLLQPQTIACAATRWFVRRRGAAPWRLALACAAAYVGCEWLVGKLLGDTLGQGLYASPWMRQAADLAGPPGLTFLLIVGNCLAVEGARRWRAGTARAALGPALAIAASALFLAGYGAWRSEQLAEPTGDPIAAGVVQANMSDYARLAAALGTYDATQVILDRHFALSMDLLQQPLDLLVWPETVYPTTFGKPKSAAGAELDARIEAFTKAVGTPLVFGAYDSAAGREYNAAVFLTPRGERTSYQIYRKARLFPLTERVPRWLDSAWLRERLPWLGTWQPGNGAAKIGLPLADGRTVQIAPLICYDALDAGLALDAVRRGAEVILTLSNDSWFAGGAGARLHFVVSAFRSIETRRAQIRATNTGISACFDRLGEAQVETAANERAAFVASVVPERDARTLLLAWGNWFGPFAALLWAALLAVSAASRRR